MDLKKTEVISFSSAMLNFFIWIILFFEGRNYASYLSHNTSIVNSIDSIISITEIFFVIFFIIILLFRARAQLFFGFISIIIWSIYMIIQSPVFLPDYIDPFTAIKIRAAIIINAHYWLFFLIGVISLSHLTSVIVKKIENVIRTRDFEMSFLLIPLLLSIFVSFFHNILQAWNLEFPLIILLGILSIYFNIKNNKSSKIENSKKLALNNKIDDGIDNNIENITINREKYISHHNIIIHFFLLIFHLLLFYIITFVSIGTLYYHVVSFSVGASLLGVLIVLFLLDLIKQSMIKNKNLSLRPIFYYFIGLIIVIINLIIQLVSLNFSDSTYETNMPIHITSFTAGLALGFIMFSIIQWYSNFTPKIFDERSNKIKKIKYLYFLNYLGRHILIYGLLFAIFYGLFEGLRTKFFNVDYGTTLILGMYVLVVLVSIIFVGLILILKKKQHRISSRNILNLSNKISEFNDTLKINHKSYFKASFLVFASLLSLFTIVPLVIPVDANSAGYPNHLGQINSCSITEVSSFSKVSKLTLIKSPISSNENPTIKRSLAKNEFETIQIVISNWGFTNLEILNISIANSSFNGLPSAFSLPNIVKSWKGEDWVWNRFKANYIDDIIDGYPDIIYELNGEQTHVKLTPDMNETRPKPIARSFNSLSLWLTVYTGEDLSAGNYSDEIIITTNKWAQNITLLTKVWDFTLPVDHSFRTAIGNRVVFRFENRDIWTKNFLQHRMSPYFPFLISDYYIVNRTDDIVSFNFTNFEFDLNNSIFHGLDSFRITFRPAAISESCFTESFNETTISFYYQLGNFLGNKSVSWDNSKTWLDLGLVYAMDEPGESEYDIFNKWSDLVHRAHPGWKVLLTEQVEPEINDSVDIWCPHITPVNTSNIKPQKDLGQEFWYYTCCHIVDQPTVSFIDPAVDHRAIFWTGYVFNFDGFLFWDASAYVNQEVYDYYRLGFDGIGDAVMLLNDNNDLPIDTIVWDAMRDGLEDVEYFAKLQSLSPDNIILTELINEWSNFYKYPRDYLRYLDIRERVGNTIDNLV